MSYLLFCELEKFKNSPYEKYGDLKLKENKTKISFSKF